MSNKLKTMLLACVLIPMLTSCGLGIRALKSSTTTTQATGSLSTLTGPMWVTDNQINATALSGTTLYIAGSFGLVQPVVNAAIINSTTGVINNTTFSGVRANGQIRDTISDGSGGYYICGDFDVVNGVSKKYIAHILSTGKVDPNFTVNPSSSVATMVLNGSTLYIGGFFTTVGASPRAYLASVNATTGVVTSWDPSADNVVYTMVMAGTNIYAGGNFTSVNTTGAAAARSYLAAFDATNGIVRGWSPNPNNQVATLKVIGTNLYVGGAFTNISATGRNRIARLDITTGAIDAVWNPNATGGSDVKTITSNSSVSTIYIGGTFTTVGGAPRSHIAAVSAAGAGGLVAAFDPNPDGFYIDAITLSSDDSKVYAGGWYNNIGGQALNYIAQLDPTTGIASTWNANANDQINQILNAGTDIFISGSFLSAGGIARQNIAAIDITTGQPTTWNPGVNGMVDSMVVNGTSLYVAGSFSTIAGQARNNLAAVNTSTAIATSFDPNADAEVKTIAILGTTLYAGGLFSNIGGAARAKIASYDLNANAITTWDPQCISMGCVVTNILPSPTLSKVYVSGAFTFIGGVMNVNLAELSATSGLSDPAWLGGADGIVYSMIEKNGLLYVAGSFANIQGAARNGLAALDATGTPTAWDPNPNANAVNKIIISGNTLYAGGSFTLIGASSRQYFAGIDLTTGAATSVSLLPDNPIGTFELYGTDALMVGNYFSFTTPVGTEYFHGLMAMDLTTGLPL